MENSPPRLGTNTTPAIPSQPRGTHNEASTHRVGGSGSVMDP